MWISSWRKNNASHNQRYIRKTSPRLLDGRHNLGHPALTGLQSIWPNHSCLDGLEDLRMEQANLFPFHQVNRRAHGLRPHAELQTNDWKGSTLARRQRFYQS